MSLPRIAAILEDGKLTWTAYSGTSIASARGSATEAFYPSGPGNSLEAKSSCAPKRHVKQSTTLEPVDWTNAAACRKEALTGKLDRLSLAGVLCF